MTDLERIKHIEKTLGIKLNEVSLENLFTENSFIAMLNENEAFITLHHRNSYLKGCRNYSLDEEGNINGLALDFCNLSLLESNIIGKFKHITRLKLKQTNLKDYSFIVNLTEIYELDLSNNNLPNYEFLRSLKNLRALNLSGNNLSNIDEFDSLRNLAIIDLSNNNLTNVDTIKHCKNITALNLSNNELLNFDFLKSLKNLSELDLSSNNLSNVDFLRDLKNLISLNLGNNKISKLNVLKNLKKITSINLSFNKLANVDFLKSVKNLCTLDLSNNHLTNVDFLKDHTKLINLDLSDNYLTNYNFLGKLKELKILNLSNNHLSNVDFLKNLTPIISLNLSNNNLLDVTFLSKLKELRALNLSSSNLLNYEFLSELKNLTSLDLSNNYLSNYNFLLELKNLTELYLTNNFLSNADFLKNQNKLLLLDLSRNKLTNVNFLEGLTNLNVIDLSRNKLSDVSVLKKVKNLTLLFLMYNYLSNADFLEDLPGLVSLRLYGNDNLDLPQNIKKTIKNKGQFASLIRKDIDQIVNYYAQLKEAQELIFEAKVLVVGEPKAGKTTLTQKIKDNEKWVKEMKGKDSAQTVGIEIAKIPIPYHKDKSKEITAHFWDFGGQDIQYVLHQYFFTERSLYVLLADGRKELPNFNYWFEIIATLGRDCPVLVVLNENGGKPVKTFNITEFREQFGEYLEFIEEESVNFYTDADGRFENLKNKIYLKTSNLKQIGSPLPKKWVDVRKEIEKIEEPYIDKDEFLKICNRFKLTNKDYQEQLRDYLHDLGIALNYKTDLNLRNKFILKPNWVIDSLYVVLKDNKIEKEHGRFKVDYVEELWQQEGYSLKDCDLLLGLMQKGKFEIAYKIKDNEFIVPILLPYKPVKDYRLEEVNEIRTEFQFKFMPKGIVPRLIVRLHKNIVSIDGEQIVWNKGVLLSHHDSIAEVVERDQSKQITIRVIGENIVHNRELLTIIRNEIHGIDRDWFENRLKFDEFVPCTCVKCKELKESFESLSEPELKNLNENERKSLELKPYTLYELQERLRDNVYQIECRKSYKQIPIQDLLKDIYIIVETMENKESKTIIISDINGNVIFDSNIKDSTVKNLVKQSDNFEAIYKKLDEMFEKLNERQSDELESLTDDFFTLIDEKLVKENKLSAEQVEAVNNAKYSSDTKLKLKVGLPLASLTGIDASVEHEFKMSKEIKADGVIRFLRKILGHDDLQTISPKQLED